MTANATYAFGAADAKISKLLTDTGSAPTYGPAIDVPGLKSIQISSSSSTKELRGDHRSLAKISVIEKVEVTLEFAKWDPTIYSIMTGATVTEGEDGAYRVALGATPSPSYFRVQAVSVNAEGEASNVDIVLPKVIASDLPDMVGLSEEDFKTVSIKCEAIPLASGSGNWLEWGYNPEGIAL